MSQLTLKLHWSSSKPNFGDALSPLICEKLSGRKIEHAPIHKCDLVAIGSLMQRAKEGLLGRSIDVWGTGFIESGKPHKSKHRYHAMRGKLSSNLIANITKDVALGDPGLLSSILLPEPNKIFQKKYKLGIVCHYKDKSNPTVKTVTENHKDIIEIDIFQEPIVFLKKILECEVIASSAMHGLIASDALGIPNQWLKLSNQLRGEDFKFKDYYSIFSIDPNAASLKEIINDQSIANIHNSYSRANIDAIKNHLIRSFPYLGSEFSKGL